MRGRTTCVPMSSLLGPLWLGPDSGIDPSIPPGMFCPRPSIGSSFVSVALEFCSRITIVGGMFGAAHKRHGFYGPCGRGGCAPESRETQRHREYGGIGVT